MDILPQLVLNSIIAGATLFYYMRLILTTSRSIKLEVPAVRSGLENKRVLFVVRFMRWWHSGF